MNNISTFGKQCKLREIDIFNNKNVQANTRNIENFYFFKLSYFESIDYNILL